MKTPTTHQLEAALVWAKVVLLLVSVLVLLTLSGCVRNVTVCATYDRRLGGDAYSAKDGAGASVCADMSPPGAE